MLALMCNMRQRIEQPPSLIDWLFLFGLGSFDGEMPPRHEEMYLKWATEVVKKNWELHEKGQFHGNDFLFAQTVLHLFDTKKAPGQGHFVHAPSMRNLFHRLVPCSHSN